MSDYPSAIRHPQLEAASHTNVKIDRNAAVDTPTGAKQKRKRTSPRDHAILEAAYQRNSKPDKEERLKLVEQVKLGEKEVQIWFQNRRQNDRRKSKPLQPHELIPHFRNGIPVEATHQLPSPQHSQERFAQQANGPSTSDSAPHDQLSPRSHNLSSLLNPPASQTASSSLSPPQQSPVSGYALSTPPSSLERPATGIDASTSQQSPCGTAMSQVTKKRTLEQMIDGTGVAGHEEEAPKETRSLRRTSSFVRLAVSADGSVKIRVNNELTPSPPKERPQPPPNMVSRRASGLSRAQSDASSTLNFRDTTAMKGPPGRSRDARTWEFYCDRSSRSSLAARAEQAATGSAAGAIGLVRFASQRRQRPLAANSSRQNKQNNQRRSQSALKAKPSLSRTQSSMARLQSSDTMHNREASKEQHGSCSVSSGSDSDKENWLPGTRDSVHQLRRTELASSRTTILQSPTSAPHPHSHPRILPSGDDEANRALVDDGKDKAKGDDLDCIQGLLSLSQGAWR